MKINIWAIIRYLMIIALIVLFILVFKQNYLVFLLFPYVLLPIISIPVFLTNVKRLTVESGANESEAEINSTIHFYVEYNNPSFFPFLKCVLKFNAYNVFLNRGRQKTLNFSMLRKNTERIYICVLAGRTGMTEFETEQLLITDYLGIVTKKYALKSVTGIPVFPANTSDTDVLKLPYSEGYDEYSEPDMKGNISSDTKEIREYRPGDRLTRIHWKISSKLDELMVKEPDRTSVMSVVILPEPDRSCIFDTIDTLFSVAADFIEKGERFEICLFNHNSCSFEFYVINNSEALTECFREMYYLPVCEKGPVACEAYYASAQKASLLLSIHGTRIKLLEDGLEVIQDSDKPIV